MSTELVQKEVKLPALEDPIGSMPALGELLRRLKPRLGQLLTSAMTPERMMRILQGAASRNPQILECTVTSLQNAIVTASAFGLEVNTPLGLAFIIPYFNGKTKKREAQFQIGYQGVITLAYNSGRVDSIYAEAVHENDTFEISYGLQPTLKHVPPIRGSRGDIVGYYAVVKIKGTDPLFKYMSHEEIMDHAIQYSRPYQRDIKEGRSESLWSKPPKSSGHEWMCKKTVIFQACKTAPKSIDDKFALSLAHNEDDFIDTTSSSIESFGQSVLNDSCAGLIEDSGDTDAGESGIKEVTSPILSDPDVLDALDQSGMSNAKKQAVINGICKAGLDKDAAIARIKTHANKNQNPKPAAPKQAEAMF